MLRSIAFAAVAASAAGTRATSIIEANSARVTHAHRHAGKSATTSVAPERSQHVAVQLVLVGRRAWLVRAMRPCATREAILVDRHCVMLARTSAVIWEGLSRPCPPKGLAIFGRVHRFRAGKGRTTSLGRARPGGRTRRVGRAR